MAGGYRWVSVREKHESPQRITLAEAGPDVEWRPVTNCDGLTLAGPYLVSSRGHVKSYKTGREMALRANSEGYTETGLHTDASRPRRFLVHRLVAAAFLPDSAPELEVDHIDGDRGNNVAGNLRCVTAGAHNRKTHGKPVFVVDPETGLARAQYATVTMAARALKVSEQTLRRRAKSGAIIIGKPLLGPTDAGDAAGTPAEPASRVLTDTEVDELLADWLLELA